MLHVGQQASLAISSMPLSRMVYPVVSAMEQMSLSPPSCQESQPSLPLQSEDMVTNVDKDQPVSHSHEVSELSGEVEELSRV